MQQKKQKMVAVEENITRLENRLAKLKKKNLHKQRNKKRKIDF